MLTTIVKNFNADSSNEPALVLGIDKRTDRRAFELDNSTGGLGLMQLDMIKDDLSGGAVRLRSDTREA